tara:strand:+ start:20474 stop:20800 length:327 start_codon:yes stop_codon:yes gene_type:complete
MNPKALVEKWVDAFNQANAKKLADFYHDDAINHQVANEPVIGKQAIEEMFFSEFNSTEMVCIPEHIFEDGEWVILEWKDPLGLKGCGFFHITQGRLNCNGATGTSFLF